MDKQPNELSALEKAKLLKSKKVEEKAQTEEEIKQQKIEEEKVAQGAYQSTTEEIKNLQGEREKLLVEIQETRNARKENISTQRAAVKELVGSEEGMEIMNDVASKEEIFSADEAGLEEVKSNQGKLEQQVKDIDSKISSLEEKSKEEYSKTPEGIKEKLAEEIKILEGNLDKANKEFNDIKKKNPNGPSNSSELKYKIQHTNEDLSKITKMELEFQDFIDSPIVTIKRKNGSQEWDWITSGKIAEDVTRIEDNFSKIRSLESEKKQLEEEKKKATFGMGNAARNKRLNEIEEDLKKRVQSDTERHAEWTDKVLTKDTAFKKLLNGSEFGSYKLSEEINRSVNSGEPLKKVFEKMRESLHEEIIQTEKLKVDFEKKEKEISELKLELEEKKKLA